MKQSEQNKRPSLLSHIIKFLVPLIVTVGLCWVMFRHIDYHDMMEVIHKHCQFGWIALALVLSILSQVFRAYRWGIQLSALGVKTPAWVLILSIFGTYSVNLVFPRLGEVWRTGYIANRQHAQFSTVFGSMVAERFADFITVFTLTLVTFILASSTIISYLMQNSATWHTLKHIILSPWIWAFVVLCVAAVWILLKHKSKSGSILSKIQGFAHGLWKGFSSIVTMPGKGKWLLLTLALWGCYFVQMYVAFFAFPFTHEALANDGIIVVLVTYVLSSIAMAVPSNGGIGPWQWAVMFALGIYGVDKVDSAAFANLVLGTQTLLLIILGIFTFLMVMLDHRRQLRKSPATNK